MSGSIRLHPKHGLNPTMPLCIVCHEPTGEIALLGAAYKGEAPMHMVMGIEPCDACRAKYLADGVLLAECELEWHNGKEHKKPTGRVMVIKAKAFEAIFNTAIPKGHIAQVEVGLLAKLQVQFDKAAENERSGETGVQKNGAP